MALVAPRNLGLLCWIRALAIMGQLVAILLVSRGLMIPLPEAPLFVILMLMALLTLATHVWLQRQATVSECHFFVQLCLDMFGLAALLYLTGGAKNPFAYLFLLQVMIAAATLPRPYPILSAMLALGLYYVLLFWRVEIPYLYHRHLGEFFSLYMQGMAVGFALLVCLSAWFVARMAATMRLQQMRLAESDRMASLGALAATAAHGLGTPLANLQLLVEALGQHVKGAKGKTQLGAMREEIDRCKEQLRQVGRQAGALSAESGQATELGEWLHGLRVEWEQASILGLGEVKQSVQVEGYAPNVRVLADAGLNQALRHLVDNALEAARTKVDVRLGANDAWMWMMVTDDGPGLSSAAEIGESSKGGMGLGIYLTRTLIERLGGALCLENQTGGGVMARVRLPLQGIRL